MYINDTIDQEYFLRIDFVMIGYAVSSHDGENFENIGIKVFYADDFSSSDTSAPDEVYSVSRSENAVRRIDSKNGEYRLSYFIIKDICRMVENEEYKRLYPVILIWRYSFSELECIKAEYAWNLFPALPFLAYNSGNAYINITSVFGRHSNKMLFSSLMCKAVCMAFNMCKIYDSAPFVNCFGHIYAEARALGIINGLFPVKPKNAAASAYICGGRSLSGEKIFENINPDLFARSEYTSSRHRCAVNVERDCVCDVVKIIKQSTEKGFDSDYIKRRIERTVKNAAEELKGICTEFLSSSMLERLSDAGYLTCDHILNLFIDAEKRINVRKTVRETKEKCRYINKLKIPDVILPNGKLVFFSE